MQHSAPATSTVTQPQVICDGGGGALGHPRVFLTMPASGTLACPYCGQVYVLASSATMAGH